MTQDPAGQPFPDQPPPGPAYPAQPPPGPAYPPQPTYPPPPPNPYGYWSRPEHSGATTALVLGIIGLAASPFTLGLALVLSPIAWVIAQRTLREMRAMPGYYANEGRARAGLVLGVVGSVLLVLAVLLFILVVVLATAVTSSGTVGVHGSGV